MALYIISYDLRTPGQDYPDLTKKLKAMGAAKVLLSVWLLPSSKTPSVIYDEIVRDGKLDANDRILVAQVANNAAWRRLMISDDEAKQLFQKAA